MLTQPQLLLRQNLDAMFNYLALKHTKSELTKSITKLITKIGNLGLRIDMKNARQTKLGTVTRNHPKGFSKLECRNALQIQSQNKQFPFISIFQMKKDDLQTIDQISLLNQNNALKKVTKRRQNGKVQIKIMVSLPIFSVKIHVV